MDGTLIEMNFVDDIKKRTLEIANSEQLVVKYDDDGDVDMEDLIANLSSDGKEKVQMATLEMLQLSMDNMAIQVGGPELIAYLGQRGIKRAVLTYNYEKNAMKMQQLYSNERSEAEFDLIIGRDSLFDDSSSTVPPGKEQRICQICKVWGCTPSEVIMVGDSIADDIVDGNRAGCAATILLQPDGYEWNRLYGKKVGSAEERAPTLCVESLVDVKECLECTL